MGAERKDGQSGRTIPNSMRHKRILDVAATRPDASLEAIAAEVPSATADLVEHVLEKYGDPADQADHAGDQQDRANQGDQAADPPDDGSAGVDDAATDDAAAAGAAEEEGDADRAGDRTLPELSELSEKQRTTLRAIYDEPELTQRELGERLGVSSATVCNRVNAIEGFDWEHRREITTALFGATDAEATEPSMASNSPEHETRIDDLQERIATLERRLEDLTAAPEADSGLQDPELVQKVMHACLEAETITEEEELRLLKTFLQ